MKKPIHLLLFTLSLFTIAGCGEDEPAPNPPEITVGQALCRSLDAEHFTLDRLDVTVVDLDGFSDPASYTVHAIIEAVSVEMEQVPQTWNPEDGKCKNDDCKMLYRWERSPDSGQFFCGDDGKLLRIEFEIIDPSGLSQRVFIVSNPR